MSSPNSNQTLNSDSEKIEELLRRYFDGCNRADSNSISECFIENAVHFYAPPNRALRGARTLGDYFQDRVERSGFHWTIDQLFVDPLRDRAVIEWSRFDNLDDKVTRGVDLFFLEKFEKRFQIKEIHAYWAAPWKEGEHNEMVDFDYESRGYPIRKPC